MEGRTPASVTKTVLGEVGGTVEGVDIVAGSLDRFTRQVYIGRTMIRRVNLARTAQKQLRRVPRHVAVKLQAWIEMVENQGLEQARKIPGFHDEALGGPRQGQRSIRLSQAFRAIYEIETDAIGELARVKEVTNHEY